MKEVCFCWNDECFNICFWISTFIVPFITFFVIQGLRPRLCISCLQVTDHCVKVSVSNRSWFFDANNVRIEICVVERETNYTYHFKPDHSEFLILPCRIGKRDNTKKFVTRQASQSALIILRVEEENQNLSATEGFSKLKDKLNTGGEIRVRCHAYHSFSGLGKSFEKVF